MITFLVDKKGALQNNATGSAAILPVYHDCFSQSLMLILCLLDLVTSCSSSSVLKNTAFFEWGKIFREVSFCNTSNSPPSSASQLICNRAAESQEVVSQIEFARRGGSIKNQLYSLRSRRTLRDVFQTDEYISGAPDERWDNNDLQRFRTSEGK